MTARLRRPAVALAAGLVVLLAGVVATLALTREKEGYTNQVPNFGAAAIVPAGETLCQAGEPVPRDVRSVRIFTGTEGKPAGPLELQVSGGRGAPVLRARTARPFVTGPVTFRVGRSNPELGAARFCVANRGRYDISIGGAPTGTDARIPGNPPVGAPGRVGRVPQLGRVRVEYPGGGRRAVAQAGTVARRAGLVKASFFGSWTLWLALALTLGAVGLALMTVLREERPA